jgi:manganese/zinc/iron transport system permease protein
VSTCLRCLLVVLAVLACGESVQSRDRVGATPRAPTTSQSVLGNLAEVRAAIPSRSGTSTPALADPRGTLGVTFLGRLARLVSLQDYNTWAPLLATALLGVSAGVVGTLVVLRGRALVGDVVGHAALPGIVLAFLIQVLAGGTGRWVPALLAGALVTGLAGAVATMAIDRYSRARADAALAIVLSLFYGGGTVLLSVAQRTDSASQAGLKNYLSGQTASLVASDVWLSAGLAAVVISISLLLFKEWTLLCFDEAFLTTQGYPSGRLDALLIGVAAVVSVLGMQSVGLVLVVGLLIIPPAAARFWTDDIRWMAGGAAAIGAASGALGVAASSLAPRVAAGPTIILVSAAMFAVSLCCGRRRGLLWRWFDQRRMRIETARQDLLRAMYEVIETASGGVPDAAELTRRPVPISELAIATPGGPAAARRAAESAVQAGLLQLDPGPAWRLTPAGAQAASRTTRNHRLWELYLLEYADVAPAHVHRHADAIEHVLEPGMVAELERLLAARSVPLPPVNVPPPA